MSGITNYQRNGQFYYQTWVSASCASGASGCSGASGASGCSGASGASGYYQNLGTADKLSVDEILELFSKGNLTKDEMEKWISAHRNEITQFSYKEDEYLVTYDFTHNGKHYMVSCSVKAAESQTDNVTQNTWSKSTLQKTYKLDEAVINKYFVLASSNGSTEMYALNPEYGFKNISELKAHLKKEDEHTKNTSFLQEKVTELQTQLNDIQGFRTTLKQKMEDLYNQAQNLEVQTPPSKIDYVDENGNFDELAYDKAYQQYEQAKIEYDRKQNELNQMIEICQRQDMQLELKESGINATIQQITEFSKMLDELKTQIENTNDPTLKSELQAKYNELQEVMQYQLDLQQKMQDIMQESMTIEVPTPPSKIDFAMECYSGKIGNNNVEVMKDGDKWIARMVEDNREIIIGNAEAVYNANGNVIAFIIDGKEIKVQPNNIYDEMAYNNAWQQYEQAKIEYDKKQNELNQKINICQEQINKFQIKTVSISTTAELIKAYSDKLDEIQKAISETSDPAKKAELQKQYAEIQRLAQEALQAKQNEDDALTVEIDNLAVPIPPSKNDFAMECYSGKIGNNNVEVMKDGDKWIVRMVEDNREIIIGNAEAVYNANGNVVAFIIDGKEIKVQPNDTYDAIAYDNAWQQYEQAKIEYENKVKELHQKVEASLKELDNINNKAGVNYVSGNDIEMLIKQQELEREMMQINQQRNTLSNTINRLTQELYNLEVPTPPSKIDYVDENGNFDEVAYDKAYQQYEQAKIEYDRKQNELNQMIEIAQRQYNQLELRSSSLENQRTELREFSENLNFIKEKLYSTDNPKLKAELQEKYNTYKSLAEKATEITKQINDVSAELMQIEVPTPPSKLDFAYQDENGRITYDEIAYSKAYNQYQTDKSVYESKVDDLNAQLKDLHNKHTQIRQQMDKLYNQIKDLQDKPTYTNRIPMVDVYEPIEKLRPIAPRRLT